MLSPGVLPLRLSAAAVVLFTAGYLPWGTIRWDGMPTMVFDGPVSDGGGFAAISLTGWNGSSSFLGVWTPNWAPFATALLLAGWSWFDAGLALRRWPQWLAVAMILHALFLVYTILATQGTRLGLGTLVDLATWTGVLVALRRAGKAASQ